MATSCWPSDQSIPQVLVKDFLLGHTIDNDRAKDPHGNLMAALTARHLTSRLQIQQLARAAVYVKAFTTGFISAVTPASGSTRTLPVQPSRFRQRHPGYPMTFHQPTSGPRRDAGMGVPPPPAAA
jgi:hypothetical protein